MLVLKILKGSVVENKLTRSSKINDVRSTCGTYGSLQSAVTILVRTIDMNMEHREQE